MTIQNKFCFMMLLACNDPLSTFNGSPCIHINGVQMGLPFRPTLVNIFLCHYKNYYLAECPTDQESTSFTQK